MASKDEKTSGGSNTWNENRGDNTNSIENVQAGDIEQRNEIHQHTNTHGTTIRDPNNLNAWIQFCEWVSQLPVSENKLVLSTIGTGGVGLTVSVLWAYIRFNGITGDMPSFQGPFFLAIISGALLLSAAKYVDTDELATCPDCDTRFALYTEDVRKTDVTEIQNGQNIIHGERDIECRECGYTSTEPDRWTPQEFSRIME